MTPIAFLILWFPLAQITLGLACGLGSIALPARGVALRWGWIACYGSAWISIVLGCWVAGALSNMC